jgi:hypothetical protein
LLGFLATDSARGGGREANMAEYRRSRDENAVPVVFCRRQEKWLPIEEHAKCEFCAAPVFDPNGDPVSFICLHDGEKREFQHPAPPPPPDEETGTGD